jgi:glycosyltransferase involved in cell wall biosynthesis
MPRFSIILPIRNGGTYAKECINSILSQTNTDFTLHVLDNASTDGTTEWINSLNDQRIILLPSEKSLTIEENWGRIKEIQKNEFMTMIGHDDVLHADYLAEMEALIAKHPNASLYQTHYRYIDKDGNTTRNCLPMDEVQQSYEFLACQMNQTIDSTGTGYMMRSKDFEETGGMPGHYPNLIFSDFELWIKLSAKTYKATSPKECFQYREHFSVSRITNGQQYEKAFGTYVQFLTGLQSDANFARVLSRYGAKFLLYFCESLCHRVLKTPVKNRQIRVADVVENFRRYAKTLVPGQSFEPMQVARIRYAVSLDKSSITRTAFQILRKIG